MALVDGRVDRARIARALAYAQALGHDADGVRDLAELGRGHLAWVRADAQRQNMRSIAGDDVAGPLDAWILPYREKPDPALAARYRALGDAPAGSLGRAFHAFYVGHGFPFPGEATAVNAGFGTPHDSTHLLSGYDTSPQGELLVSTFTAGMHAREPMSGHILPVIMSWHLGIELVEFAGSTTGALDAAKFWRAWERGSAVTVDVFAAGLGLLGGRGRTARGLASALRRAPARVARRGVVVGDAADRLQAGPVSRRAHSRLPTRRIIARWATNASRRTRWAKCACPPTGCGARRRSARSTTSRSACRATAGAGR